MPVLLSHLESFKSQIGFAKPKKPAKALETGNWAFSDVALLPFRRLQPKKKLLGGQLTLIANCSRRSESLELVFPNDIVCLKLFQSSKHRFIDICIVKRPVQ